MNKEIKSSINKCISMYVNSNFNSYLTSFGFYFKGKCFWNNKGYEFKWNQNILLNEISNVACKHNCEIDFTIFFKEFEILGSILKMTLLLIHL